MDSILSQYYMIIQNDSIKMSLPEGVSFQNQTLIFDNQEPVEIEVIYQLTNQEHFSMHYQFERNVQVNLIEIHEFASRIYFEKNNGNQRSCTSSYFPSKYISKYK